MIRGANGIEQPPKRLQRDLAQRIGLWADACGGRRPEHQLVVRLMTPSEGDIGGPLWADRARAELARTRAGPRPDAELSLSERLVAELLASGMTRKEVATTMFISPKTVEAHLARIYRKLDIHSGRAGPIHGHTQSIGERPIPSADSGG